MAILFCMRFLAFYVIYWLVELKVQICTNYKFDTRFIRII